MASVGAISFAFVSRATEPPAEQVEEITRPHVDGMALRKLGTKGRPFRLVGVLGEVDAAAAQAKVNLIEGLASTVVSIVDDHSLTWEKVVIIAVRIREMKGIAQVAGLMAGSTKIITVDFECRDTRVAP